MTRWQYPAHGTFRNVATLTRNPDFRAVRVHVLRPFYGHGRVLRAGEVVELPEPSARDSVAIGRAEYV